MPNKAVVERLDSLLVRKRSTPGPAAQRIDDQPAASFARKPACETRILDPAGRKAADGQASSRADQRYGRVPAAYPAEAQARASPSTSAGQASAPPRPRSQTSAASSPMRSPGVRNRGRFIEVATRKMRAEGLEAFFACLPATEEPKCTSGLHGQGIETDFSSRSCDV